MTPRPMLIFITLLVGCAVSMLLASAFVSPSGDVGRCAYHPDAWPGLAWRYIAATAPNSRLKARYAVVLCDARVGSGLWGYWCRRCSPAWPLQRGAAAKSHHAAGLRRKRHFPSD